MSPLLLVASVAVLALVLFSVFAGVVHSLQVNERVPTSGQDCEMPDGTILSLTQVNFGKSVRNGLAVRVELSVGLTNDFEVEVLSGLQAGEQVILAPESGLNDGQRVQPQ